MNAVVDLDITRLIDVRLLQQPKEVRVPRIKPRMLTGLQATLFVKRLITHGKFDKFVSNPNYKPEELCRF